MKFRLTLAATLLLGALPLTAYAQQPWIADRRYGEGAGARVGNLELHPGISAEVGYDSNYFLRSPSDQPGPEASYRLRVTPSITLSTLGPQRRDSGSPAGPSPLIFSAGAYASYNELIAASSANSSDFSNQRHVDLGGNLRLELFPAGRVGVDSYANFTRMVQPSNAADVSDAFDRDTVQAGAGATWRPGGGLFSWRLGYEFGYNFFEKDPFKPLNNYTNEANLRGRWRFLPRSALLYDGSYTWITYTNNGDPTSVQQNSGGIVRSRIGFNGLVTNHFALLAMVGWAGSFYDTKSDEQPDQFDSIIGQAEVKWFISGQQELSATSAPVGLSWVALGYTRDVQNSYLGNFYQRDRGYAAVSYLLGGVFVASLNAGIANIAFPGVQPTNGGPNTGSDPFSEQRFDASLFGEYRVSNTVGINTTINYNRNFTSATNPSNPPVGVIPDYLDYAQWQAFLGVRWFL